MVAGADKQPSLFFHLADAIFDDYALRWIGDHGGHVQMIAGQNDNIEISSNLFDPVELLKRIMKVGREKTSHSANFLHRSSHRATGRSTRCR
jgi:hypothetical protein